MTDNPPSIKLKRPAFHVWLAPEGVDPNTAGDDELAYHHVVVHNGDQLRAELEAGKLHLRPRENPQHVATMWVWAAMVRTGVYEDRFPAFKLACVNYEADHERDEPHDDPNADLDDLDESPTVASSS